jgi:hypothetical protein
VEHTLPYAQALAVVPPVPVVPEPPVLLVHIPQAPLIHWQVMLPLTQYAFAVEQAAPAAHSVEPVAPVPVAAVAPVPVAAVAPVPVAPVPVAPVAPVPVAAVAPIPLLAPYPLAPVPDPVPESF